MNLHDQLLADLSGGTTKLQGLLSALFSGVPGGHNPTAAGHVASLPALVRRFQAVGLANVMQSWISRDANDPITPAQLRLVLSESEVAAMAAQADMTQDDLLFVLSMELPSIIDQLTPNGVLPAPLLPTG